VCVHIFIRIVCNPSANLKRLFPPFQNNLGSTKFIKNISNIYIFKYVYYENILVIFSYVKWNRKKKEKGHDQTFRQVKRNSSYVKRNKQKKRKWTCPAGLIGYPQADMPIGLIFAHVETAADSWHHLSAV
jgi:hypothetical protein